MTVKVTAAGVKKYTARRHKKDKPVFISGKGYQVHSFDHDDGGNGYVILVNEYREVFWISNKLVRVVDECEILNRNVAGLFSPRINELGRWRYKAPKRD